TSHVCRLFISLLFSHSRSIAPRALHSFPTRRSSDLAPITAITAIHGPQPMVRRSSRPRPKPSRRSTPERIPRPISARTAPEIQRSEEHTSELQSRFDLVCRLLLEKKKKLTEK